MNLLVKVTVILTIVPLIVLFLWWLLVTTEGVYLGRRVVIWLYDVYASRYDSIKEFDPAYEAAYISRPLVAALQGKPAPMILDVATGTGRVPLTFLEDRQFAGNVIGLDLSRKMLGVAAEKLEAYLKDGRARLICCSAEKLPFPDESFDIVTCLEALEFMPRPREVIAEIVRVARPGAIVLLTNRQGSDTIFFPGRTQSHEQFQAMLESEFGLEGIRFEKKWVELYALVWAHKAGQSEMKGIRPLGAFLQCPRCHETAFRAAPDGLYCARCRLVIRMGTDGVIELNRWEAKEKH